MWLTERRAAGDRDKQLADAQQLLTQSQKGMDVLLKSLDDNTRAITALESTQRALIDSPPRLGRGRPSASTRMTHDLLSDAREAGYRWLPDAPASGRRVILSFSPMKWASEALVHPRRAIISSHILPQAKANHPISSPVPPSSCPALATHPLAVAGRTAQAILNVGLALLAIWFCSGFFGIAFSFTGRQELALRQGRIEFNQEGPAGLTTGFTRGLRFFRNPSFHLNNTAQIISRDPHDDTSPSGLGLPFWWLALPVALAGSIMAWRTHARAIGLCIKRHYAPRLGSTPDASSPRSAARPHRQNERRHDPARTI